MNLKFKTFALILFVTGLILFAFNLSGLFLSLRNETLSREITPYKNDISIPFTEVRKQWSRHKGENDQEFAIRMTLLSIMLWHITGRMKAFQNITCRFHFGRITFYRQNNCFVRREEIRIQKL